MTYAEIYALARRAASEDPEVLMVAARAIRAGSTAGAKYALARSRYRAAQDMAYMLRLHAPERAMAQRAVMEVTS